MNWSEAKKMGCKMDLWSEDGGRVGLQTKNKMLTSKKKASAFQNVEQAVHFSLSYNCSSLLLLTLQIIVMVFLKKEKIQ